MWWQPRGACAGHAALHQAAAWLKSAPPGCAQNRMDDFHCVELALLLASSNLVFYIANAVLKVALPAQLGLAPGGEGRGASRGGRAHCVWLCGCVCGGGGVDG